MINIENFGASPEAEDNHAALKAAVQAAARKGEDVYIPREATYRVVLAGQIGIPKPVRLIGAGRGSVIECVKGAGTILFFLLPGAGHFELRGLTVVGPGAGFCVYQGDTSMARITFRDVRVARWLKACRSGARKPEGAVVEFLDGSEIVECGQSVMVTGRPGASAAIARATQFSSDESHCVYLDTPTRADFSDCDFLSSTHWAWKWQFGAQESPGLSVFNRCVVHRDVPFGWKTPHFGPTMSRDCTFRSSKHGIELAGGNEHIFEDCVFFQPPGGTCVWGGGRGRFTFRRCEFTGQPDRILWLIDDERPGLVEFEDCEFSAECQHQYSMFVDQKAKANLRFHRCTFRTSAIKGLLAQDSGSCEFVDCDFSESSRPLIDMFPRVTPIEFRMDGCVAAKVNLRGYPGGGTAAGSGNTWRSIAPGRAIGWDTTLT